MIKSNAKASKEKLDEPLKPEPFRDVIAENEPQIEDNFGFPLAKVDTKKSNKPFRFKAMLSKINGQINGLFYSESLKDLKYLRDKIIESQDKIIESQEKIIAAYKDKDAIVDAMIDAINEEHKKAIENHFARAVERNGNLEVENKTLKGTVSQQQKTIQMQLEQIEKLENSR